MAHVPRFLNRGLPVCGGLWLALVVLIVLPRVAHGDWPTFRHDRERSGFTPGHLTHSIELRWTLRTDAAPRRAWAEAQGREIEGHDIRNRVDYDAAPGLVVAQERVVFSSSVDQQVHCVEAGTGDAVWSFYTDAPVRLAPTIWRDRVLFGSDDGYAYCVTLEDGQLAWRLRAGPAEDWLIARGELVSRWPIRTGVLVDDGIAYFGAGIFPHEDVQLYAVDAASGEVLWKRDDISALDAGRNDLSPQGYLLATDDFLFVTSGRSLPAAMERATGKLVHKRVHSWRTAAGGVVGGTSALLADGQIYSGGAHHAVALEQESGDVGFGWFVGRRMAIAGETAYAVTGTELLRIHREVYAVYSQKRQKLRLQLRDVSRKLRRAKTNKKTKESELVKLEKEVAETESSIEKLVERGVLWKVPCAFDAELVVAANKVVVGGRGEVAMYDAATGNERGRYAVDGEARQLAVADGRLFVSTDRGTVHCLDVKPPVDAEPIAFTDRRLRDVSTGGDLKEPFAEDSETALYVRAAEEILRVGGVSRGFCLVLGSETGRLAYELARQSELKIYGVESDPDKVQSSRRALTAAGLYGHRVTIHQSVGGRLPFSNYFANLVVSDTLLRTGELPPVTDVARHVKPCGGVLLLGRPGGSTDSAAGLVDWMRELEWGAPSMLGDGADWVVVRRPKLPGAGDWSHQYGEPGNTACSEDEIVKGGLGVLWYGDPGPGKMVNRHEGAVGPVCTNGRFFIQGENSLIAHDAYNGLFLWERQNPKALRTGVFRNENPANLVATDDSVFYLVGASCVELEAATGKLKRAYHLPSSKDPQVYEWGYLAVEDGVVFGTATVRKRVEERLVRRGKQTEDTTDAIFAVATDTGDLLWTYEGGAIESATIAISDDRVFFVDSTVTSEERQTILRQNKSRLETLTGEAREIAEKRLKEADVRTAVALDAGSGEKQWATAVDVTDCSEIGTGGGKLTVMYKNDTLILCGANANGHYWKQFLEGEFWRRRLVALSAANGYQLWAKDANYRHRPIIVGDQIIAEPWRLDLESGKMIKREHPLTGEQEPWSMVRPGHHCGMISAAAGMLLFRSGYTGFYDLETDSGTQHFAGHRLGCWINAIPAGGLVLIPEASAGCVCLFSIASTVALEPRAPRRPWTIFSAVGDVRPVKHMALNFGAPGDRRDERGTLWLSYPRPSMSKETGLDLAFEVKTEFATEGGFGSVEFVSREDARLPAWVHGYGARGMTQCRIPLQEKDSAPATYSVKLYLAATAASGLKPETVEVSVQGERVTGAQTKGAITVHALDDVEVGEDLLIELSAEAVEGAALCAVEVERRG